ncbi:MAG: amidase [Bacillota bacterium]
MYLHPASLARIVSDLKEEKMDLKEHINECCDRIEKYDYDVKALLPESGRRERLLKEAEVLQETYPDPAKRPALYGALIGVKDIYQVDDFPTRAGSRLDPAALAGPEAESVWLLRQCGALILGKTVTTEFAYFVPGPTRNPHNLEHTPGGSSSGSAAAVAAGFSPLTLGTQTIGSINRPAAFCGVIGFKPSYNRISRAGLINFSPSVDHVGFFTQDIEGMIIAAETICHNWQEIDVTYKPILGVPKGPYLEQASPEALEAFNAQLKRLEKAGYSIREINVFDNIEQINKNHRKLIAAEMAIEHEDLYAKYSDLYSSQTVELIEEGINVTEKELEEVRKQRKELREEIEATMWPANLGLWVTPAATGPAPKGLQSTGDPIMNLPWTNTGMPSLTVPSGRSKEGLPLGLQLIAPFMGDELLLSWSSEVAKVFEEFQAYNL